MVSPNLIKHSKDDQPVEVNENTKRLFQVIYAEQNKSEERIEDVPCIKVSTLISGLSFFYEKIRNAVDYDEEHLLRKNAIARILRRQIVIEGVVKDVDSTKIAEHLLIELIRGSYLSNNQIPETKIQELSVMLEKYIVLKNQISSNINAELNIRADINKAKDLINKKNSLIHWLLTLAACEIEENLAPNQVKQIIVKNLFEVLSKKIQAPSGLLNKSELDLQIYLSINRNFLKFDADMLAFTLFKYYNPSWLGLNLREVLNKEDFQRIKIIAEGFSKLKKVVEDQIKLPIGKQLDKIIRANSLYASILVETITTNPVKVYNELQKDERNFVSMIRKVCIKKYEKAKKRLWRVAVRSLIYIFLTKSIFVILIEVPAIKFLGEPLNIITLAINISFPVLLLFVIVLLTRRPSEKNTIKIVEGIKEMSFVKEARKKAIVLRRPHRRNWLKDGLFRLIYVAAFLVSIYYIVLVLNKMNFTWISIIIFLFFLALVSFFGVRTTADVKELIVVERKENILTFFLDLFYMPMILVGRWLSSNFSKINIFIFFFDFIIESPFKLLVEIADDWTKYVRERRENI